MVSIRQLLGASSVCRSCIGRIRNVLVQDPKTALEVMKGKRF
jgi:hypothetical protein